MLHLPEEYKKLDAARMRGFQTWNVRSVLSHVDMETGYALNVCLKDGANGHYLKEALIGRLEEGAEIVTPECHAWDGSYTSVKVEFENVKFRIESCVSDDCPLLLLATPLSRELRSPLLVLESGFLWNRPGVSAREKNALIAVAGEKRYTVYMTAPHDPIDPNIPTQAPYLAADFDREIAFCVNLPLDLASVRSRMAAARERYLMDRDSFAPCQEPYEAMECALCWDTTYDAMYGRILTPVSRLWSISHGGYVLFCWDNYFAAFMSSLRDKHLAYSNLIAMTLSRAKAGFVPNFIDGTGLRSEDRSQPPVGSAMLREIYRIHKDRWLVEFLYPMLLQWNVWFAAYRMEADGALCWGSDPVEPKYGNLWEYNGVNDRFGAALESGLDNSPMYDGIPFDKETHRLRLKDVGLTGLYILDTRCLLEFARLLDKREDEKLLLARLARAESGLENLWDEEIGFYCNRRTDTGEFSRRLSPTNFYALFSSRVTSARRARIAQHYFDPNEFYGEWMLPSIARNDPAYPEQEYWRGRVWAPMNFLVYLAMRGYDDLAKVRADLAQKSESLLMKEWTEYRHIHENYNADTGEGCDSAHSDRFYHWGALLGIIAMAENGLIPGLGRSL